MILHPAISDITQRVADIQDAIRKGHVTPDVGRYMSPGWAYPYRSCKGADSPAIAFAKAGNFDRAEENDNTLYYVITTDEEDRDGDIVRPMGAQLKNFNANPLAFFGHQEWEIPLGVCRSSDGRILVFPEENRIIAGIRFDREDPDADFIYGKCLRKIINATSIAFVPIEAWKRDDVRKAQTHSQPMMPPGWYFNAWDLTEISLVGIPSNPKAVGLEKDLQGACRDCYDREKGFMSPKLQKAWQPYCAVAKGCWNGWCPLPGEEKDLGNGVVLKAVEKGHADASGKDVNVGDKVSFEDFQRVDNKPKKVKITGTVTRLGEASNRLIIAGDDGREYTVPANQCRKKSIDDDVTGLVVSKAYPADSLDEAEPLNTDLRWDVYVDDRFWASEVSPEKDWVLELAKWKLKDVTPKPRVEVKGPYQLDERPPPERWNKSLSNAFDVKMVESGGVSAAVTHRMASEFLSCPIKDLCSNSTMVPSPRMGSFLTGLKKTIAPCRVLETRNFGESHRGEQCESPPVFETIQLNSKSRDSFLVQGTMFLEGLMPVKRGQPGQVRKADVPPMPFQRGDKVTIEGESGVWTVNAIRGMNRIEVQQNDRTLVVLYSFATKKGSGPHNRGGHSNGLRFCVKFEPTWNGLQVTVLSKSADATASQGILDSAWAWAKKNNFLKGEAFALSGDFLQRTDEGWDDVFLETKNKKSVQRVLEQFNQKGIDFAPRGTIMTGAPGNGKTLSSRVIRNQAKGTFIWVSSKDFHASGSVGGIGLVFEMAKELAPAVICMEDVDNWLHPTTIDLLKTEMDGVARYKGVWTILTTNFPEKLPDALIDRPGRFHDVLEFDLPTKTARKAMLKKWLPLASSKAVEEVGARTEGYSGAHVYELAKFAETLIGSDGFPPDKALGEAVAKVAEQRELITRLQLEGSHYNPLREGKGMKTTKACSCADCSSGKPCGCGKSVSKNSARIIRDADEHWTLEFIDGPKAGETFGGETIGILERWAGKNGYKVTERTDKRKPALRAKPFDPFGKTAKQQPSADIDPEKACEILRDGTVGGKPLTDDQRGMFGAACARAKKSWGGLRETCKALLVQKGVGEVVISGGGSSWNVSYRSSMGSSPQGSFKTREEAYAMARTLADRFQIPIVDNAAKKALTQGDLDSPGVPGRNPNPPGKAGQEKADKIICPKCGSDNIKGSDFAGPTGVPMTRFSCRGCGQVWMRPTHMYAAAKAVGEAEGRIGGYLAPGDAEQVGGENVEKALTPNQDKIIRFCRATVAGLKKTIPINQVGAVAGLIIDNGLKTWPLTDKEKSDPAFKGQLEQVLFGMSSQSKAPGEASGRIGGYLAPGNAKQVGFKELTKGLAEDYYQTLIKLKLPELRRRQSINQQQLQANYQASRGSAAGSEETYERLEAMRRALIAAVDHVAFGGKGKALGESDGRVGGYVVPAGGLQSSGVTDSLDETRAEGWAACETCHGDGNCGTCGGSGTVEGKDCSNCGGSGECSECAGEGHVEKAVRKASYRDAKGQSIQVGDHVVDQDGGAGRVSMLGKTDNVLVVEWSGGGATGRSYVMDSTELTKKSLKQNSAGHTPPQVAPQAEDVVKEPLTTPQVLAALYSHAKAEAAYIDQLDDQYKDTLADYRRQQVEERMDMLKYRFSRVAGQDDDLEKMSKDFEDGHDQQVTEPVGEQAKGKYGPYESRLDPRGNGQWLVIDSKTGIAVSGGFANKAEADRAAAKWTQEQADVKSFESTGPESTLEPGEAGLVEQGQVPPETEVKATDYSIEQRSDGWYVVLVTGGEFGPYPSRQMAQQTVISEGLTKEMKMKDNIVPAEGAYAEDDPDAAAELDSGAAPFNKDAPSTQEWESEEDVKEGPGEGGVLKTGGACVCGAEIPEGAIECPDCGAPVEKAEAFAGEETPGEEALEHEGDAVAQEPVVHQKIDGDDCDGENNDDPECGAMFHAVTGRSLGRTTQKETCACGGDVTPNANFCPGCGNPMAQGKDDPGLGAAGGEESELKDTDPSTEEILERYRNPKSNKWATRKWWIDKALLPFVKYRVAADGKKYLVRSVLKATADEIRRAQGEEAIDSSEVKAMTAKLAGAIDDIKAIFSAPDMPKHYKPALKHVADQIWYVGKSLTDKGKEQRDGGKGSELTDKGKIQRNGGGGGELYGGGKGNLESTGSQQGKSPAKGHANGRQVSPAVERKLTETLAKLRRFGVLRA